MKTYDVLLMKKKDLQALCEGFNIFPKTLTVEVEAESVEDAIAAVEGYKGMTAYKVIDGEVVFNRTF